MTVAIIGGGPAGLFAAEALATAGRAVTVFDRMPSLGRKFLLAGRGGLNLTHSEPVEALLDRYGPARAALAPAIEAFPPEALRAWCHALGQDTFVGSSGRVFPRAFKATPLLRAWLHRLAALGVEFCPAHRWLGWTGQGALRFSIPSGEVEANPRATLLALGGASWPRMGSDGAWTDILAGRGVQITPLRPANAGVLVAWTDLFRDRFEGHPLKRIAATLAGVTIRGEAMITATGLEGGVIYALSREISTALDRDGTADLLLDLRPDLDPAALQRRMGSPALSRANAHRRAGLSPAAIALLRETHGDPKRAPIPITGLAPIARAISTAGGIALTEFDPAYMLRAIPGTFVAGEMLDWTAPTGGYLLQACFSTGFAAAHGLQRFLDHEPTRENH